MKIPLFKVFMSEEAIEAVTSVLRSGYIGQGEIVDEFEEVLKEYFNYPYLITTNSGTSALHLAIHLLKAKDGDWWGLNEIDKVLASPLTCLASNQGILANGLNLKWVDISEKDLNIDMHDLANRLTYNTKAVLLPYWGGYPVDLSRLEKILERAEESFGFKPMVIEDLAHGLGSRYRGKLMGTFGHMSMFSLQAIKQITSVDGGILMLPNEQLYKRAKLLRWYGIDREQPNGQFRCGIDVEEFGFKFNMNDVNAAIGMANFKYLPKILKHNRELAKFYDCELRNIEGLELLDYKPSHKSAYWLYTVKVQRRDAFTDTMTKNGIVTSKVHERNDIHSCFRKYRTPLPGLENVSRLMVSIPIGIWVGQKEREYIVKCINSGW